jgi:hypothetical protein
MTPVLFRYTFIWDVFYVMSSDSKQANSSWCGPDPFTIQSWTLNSTVNVTDNSPGTAGTAAAAQTESVTTRLSSKPTGKVVNAATGAGVASWANALVMFGVCMGMLA